MFVSGRRALLFALEWVSFSSLQLRRHDDGSINFADDLHPSARLLLTYGHIVRTRHEAYLISYVIQRFIASFEPF